MLSFDVKYGNLMWGWGVGMEIEMRVSSFNLSVSDDNVGVATFHVMKNFQVFELLVNSQLWNYS